MLVRNLARMGSFKQIFMQKLKLCEKIWCQHEFGQKSDFQLCSPLKIIEIDLSGQTEKHHSKNLSGGAYYTNIS